MSYWRNISPRGAIADLIDFWRQPTPYRWQILGLSVALTFTMMVLLIPESQRVPPPRPQITFITTFEAGRSDDEIVASNIENQKRQDRIEAEMKARAERRREAFRALGRASGFDVDALEKQYADDPAPKAAPAAPAAPTPSRATGEQ